MPVVTFNARTEIHRIADGLCPVHTIERLRKGRNMAVEISQIVSISFQKCGFEIHGVHSKEDYHVLIFLTNQTYLRVIFGKGYKNPCQSAASFKNHILNEMQIVMK